LLSAYTGVVPLGGGQTDFIAFCDMVEIIITVVGLLLVILGLLGSLLPILPGPPVGFAGLLLMAVARRFSEPLTPILILVLALATLGVIVFDYLLPLMMSKKYGASKWGVWGSVFGMVIGLFFSPLGVLVGAFVGAVIGEWIVHRKQRKALKAGFGVVLGSLLGSVLKLGLSGLMLWYSIRALA
jgi:uncharacterized protein YqgC (DUF456 family)